MISRRAGRREKKGTEKRSFFAPLSDVVNVCVLYVGEIGVTECEDDYVFKTAREDGWPRCSWGGYVFTGWLRYFKSCRVAEKTASDYVSVLKGSLFYTFLQQFSCLFCSTTNSYICLKTFVVETQCCILGSPVEKLFSRFKHSYTVSSPRWTNVLVAR